MGHFMLVYVGTYYQYIKSVLCSWTSVHLLYLKWNRYEWNTYSWNLIKIRLKLLLHPVKWQRTDFVLRQN